MLESLLTARRELRHIGLDALPYPSFTGLYACADHLHFTATFAAAAFATHSGRSHPLLARLHLPLRRRRRHGVLGVRQTGRGHACHDAADHRKVSHRRFSPFAFVFTAASPP
jgi:hypothetical protein